MSFKSNLKSQEIEETLQNVLRKDNTEEFVPTSDYQPATKKYVDDQFKDGGEGVFILSSGFAAIENGPVEESMAAELDALFAKVGTFYSLFIAGDKTANRQTIQVQYYKGETNEEFVFEYNLAPSEKSRVYLFKSGGSWVAEVRFRTAGYEEYIPSRTIVVQSSQFSGNLAIIPMNLPDSFTEMPVFTQDEQNDTSLDLSSGYDPSEEYPAWHIRCNDFSKVITNKYTCKTNNGDKNYEFELNVVYVPSVQILSETEYAALGESVNTDNVLYFVTPDA